MMRRFVLPLLLAPAMALAEVPQGPPASSFQPAFPEQTRAKQLATTRVTVETFAGGLQNPWGIAPLGNGQFLVTERPGRMRVIDADGSVSGPISGLPDVDNRGQGGLLDVAVSPDFASDRTVFWTYAQPAGGEMVRTAAAKGVLTADGRMTEVQDIFQQEPPWWGAAHYGSRIIPMSDGTVWITTGEHNATENAQDNSTTFGKVIRVTRDGAVPSNNPFVGRDGIDTIWSYGHRNVQGAAIAPDGDLWTIEHGPRGGDELNKPRAGRNYGWPVISYGVEYGSLAPVGSGRAVMEGMEQPVYYWDPVIAPSGMDFYDGDYDRWQGDLLIASLSPGGLVRLKLSGDKVVGEERMLTDRGRIRDVEVLDDGSVLVLADSEGAVLRITPR
ncbi:PQQ-dependent sugar dehydrogenase [Yoonia sp. 2307UL14-13]|uniref:PQQ-dependent sugar dehydrogenase n=1 Tax=Yoonia sp. 2307UL14-13 TaxID=3126506 RepID=UPI0030B4D754